MCAIVETIGQSLRRGLFSVKRIFQIIILCAWGISCLAICDTDATKKKVKDDKAHVMDVTIVTHDYGDLSTYEPHANVLYEVNLLKLALDKTVDTHGPYKLVGANKGNMTHVRAMALMREKKIHNYVKVLGYNEAYNRKHHLGYAKFPVYLGLLSYRSCFTSEKLINQLKNFTSIESFFKLKQATGVGWADAEIMRANGISVNELTNRDAIYKMLALGRVDLFCRGTNEALSDYENNKGVEGVAFDTSIAMYYPNPHFFHTNKDNVALIERLEIGLEKAYADVSLEKLWLDIFKESVDFVAINKRTIFEIYNPFVKDIPFDVQRYDFWQITEEDRRHTYGKH